MLRLGPRSSSFLAPLGFACGASAGARELLTAMGPVPLYGIALLASTVFSVLLARRLPQVGAGHRWRIVGISAPLLFLSGTDALLRTWGRVAVELGISPVHGIWLLAGGWAASLIPWAKLYKTRGQPHASWCGPALGFGVWIGLWWPSLVGLTIGTLIMVWLNLAHLPCANQTNRPSWNGTHVMALALTVSVSLGLWLSLRVATDPTLSAAMVCLGMTCLALPVGQRFSPRSNFNRVLLGCVWGIISLAIVRVAGRWSRELILQSIADTGPLSGQWAMWSVPALIGLVCGVWIGLVLGRIQCSRGATGRCLGVLLGLLTLPWLQHEHVLGSTIAIMGGWAFLMAHKKTTQINGLLIAGTAGFGLSVVLPQYPLENQVFSPNHASVDWMVDLSRGHFRLLQDPQDLTRDGKWRTERIPTSLQWGLRGTSSVWVSSSRWDPKTTSDSIPVLYLEQEGLISWSRDRAAKAEYLAGLLGAALQPNAERTLILGDPTGRALLGLKRTQPETHLGRTIIALPQHSPFTNMLQFDSDLADVMTPFETVIHAHPDFALRVQPNLDLLVDVVRAPWQDATGLALTASHLDAAQHRLGTNGTFVAVVHLNWFDNGGPQALAGRIAERFDHVQIWLPPEGADSLLFVGSQSPIQLATIQSNLTDDDPSLALLKIPDARALAAHALGNRASAISWAKDATEPIEDRLGARIFSSYPAYLHSISLAPHSAKIDETWSMDSSQTELPTEILADVFIYRETIEIFLDNLLEEAKGNPATSHALSQQLDERADPLSEAKLSELTSNWIDTAIQQIQIAKATNDMSAWTEAQRHAESAHRRAPSNPEPLVILGEILMNQGQLNSAKQKYEQALALEPENKAARWGLARIARERHDTDEMLSQLWSTVQEHPSDWISWYQLGMVQWEIGEMEDAIDALDRAASLSDGADPRPYIGLAQVQLDLGEADEALVHVNRAVHLDGSAYALFIRGRAYMELEAIDRAIENFQAAIIADPTLIDARIALGMIKGDQGDYAAAAEAFQSALRVNPNHKFALENLRRAERKLRGSTPPTGP